MPATDPNIDQRFQEAVANPQTRIVLMGARPLWDRYLSKVVAGVAVAAALSVGVSGVKDLQGWSSVTPIEQLPQQVHWVEMPTTSFLEVAKQPDGSYSMERALAAYRAAGLTPQQATEIIQRMEEFSPVVLGVSDKELETRLINQAQDAIEELSEAYPKAQEALDIMVEMGEFPLPMKVLESHTTKAPWNNAALAWHGMGVHASDVLDLELASDMEMSEAKGAAEEMMKSTGLRALRTLPTQLRSPHSLYGVAAGLEEANQDLMDITGMEGQVLGLGGRLMLKMGAPPARTNADGLAVSTLNGEVMVHAEWNNLSHEWFHAVELFATQITYKQAGLEGLLDQQDSTVVDQKALSAFSTLYQTLTEAAPTWQSARLARAKQDSEHTHAHQEAGVLSALGIQPTNPAGYWAATNEGMAYAFQAYVNTQSSVVLGANYTNTQAYRLPNNEELIKQQKAWPEFFKSMSHLKLSQAYQSPRPSSAPIDQGEFVQRLMNRKAAHQPAPSLKARPL